MVTDELRRYVAENLDLGHHPNDIAQGLIDQGWSEIDVNRVFDEFFPPESEEPAPLLTFDLKDKTFLLLVIGGFLVAILSVIFGVYVIFSGPSDEAVTSESSQTEESDIRNVDDQEQKGSPEVSIDENVYPNLTSALSCDNLPPNPGQSSLTTLEGIDANNNNIRDEIEHAFCDLYADNDELRYVQFLGAIATQKMVVAGSQNNEEALMAAVNVLEHYTSCMVKISIRDEEDISFSGKAIAVKETLVVNTPERVEAKLNANSMLSGEIFDGVDAEPEDCIRLLDTLVEASDKPDQTDNRGASIPPEPTDAVGDTSPPLQVTPPQPVTQPPSQQVPSSLSTKEQKLTFARNFADCIPNTITEGIDFGGMVLTTEKELIGWTNDLCHYRENQMMSGETYCKFTSQQVEDISKQLLETTNAEGNISYRSTSEGAEQFTSVDDEGNETIRIGTLSYYSINGGPEKVDHLGTLKVNPNVCELPEWMR